MAIVDSRIVEDLRTLPHEIVKVRVRFPLNAVLDGIEGFGVLDEFIVVGPLASREEFLERSGDVVVPAHSLSNWVNQPLHGTRDLQRHDSTGFVLFISGIVERVDHPLHGFVQFIAELRRRISDGDHGESPGAGQRSPDYYRATISAKRKIG